MRTQPEIRAFDPLNVRLTPVKGDGFILVLKHLPDITSASSI
jgi:hypothetical protein